MNSQTNNQLNNRTMPPCTVIPVLMYPNLTDAIEWLTSIAGFKERWRVGNHRAQLTLAEDTIAISEYSEAAMPGTAASRGSRPVSHSMLVRVPDVIKHFEQALENGAHIVHAPEDFPYGERQYAVKDTGNHIWTFSQSIADLAPEDWGGTTAVADHTAMGA